MLLITVSEASATEPRNQQRGRHNKHRYPHKLAIPTLSLLSVLPSAVPTSEALLPSRSSQHPHAQPHQRCITYLRPNQTHVQIYQDVLYECHNKTCKEPQTGGPFAALSTNAHMLGLSLVESTTALSSKGKSEIQTFGSH